MRFNLLTEEIPQEHLDRLKARCPSIPLAMFRFAVSRYVEADEADKPATVRNELDTLADAAIRLAAMLDEVSLAASDKLAIREVQHGCEGLSERLNADLRSLMGIAEMARRDAEKDVSTGRAISLNTRLVADLARGLRVGGGTVDARPNGELVQAFGIALSVVGKSVEHHAKIVASALKTLGKE